MLGLDTRFSRDVVHGVICLAFDVLEDMGGGRLRSRPASPAVSPGAARRMRAGLDLAPSSVNRETTPTKTPM